MRSFDWPRLRRTLRRRWPRAVLWLARLVFIAWVVAAVAGSDFPDLRQHTCIIAGLLLLTWYLQGDTQEQVRKLQRQLTQTRQDLEDERRTRAAMIDASHVVKDHLEDLAAKLTRIPR